MLNKREKSKSILVYADFGCTTGFGNVTKEIITRLSKIYSHHKFHIFALNNFEKADYDFSDNVRVHPALLYLPETRTTDPYNRMGLLRLLSKENFDLFFMFHDIELACTLTDHLEKVNVDKRKNNRKKFKSIFYFPVDSPPLEKQLECLNFFDEIATFTEYGKSVIMSMTNSPFIKRLKVINHGVNTDLFFPYSKDDKKTLQQELWNGYDFIIGSVNRNSVRKDVGTLIIGYSIFLEQSGAQNTVLYLHMNPVDPSGINIPNLCKRLNLKIGENVVFIPDFSENTGIDEADMNDIYNSFDLFVTTTTAEGWGLTVTEAMASGVPVLCPSHTSLAEIADNGRNAFILRDLHQTVFKGEDEKIRYKCNPNDIAFRLQTFYANKIHKPASFEQEISTVINNAQDFVSKLNWDRVAAKFKTLFDKFI